MGGMTTVCDAVWTMPTPVVVSQYATVQGPVPATNGRIITGRRALDNGDTSCGQPASSPGVLTVDNACNGRGGENAHCRLCGGQR